MLGNTGISRVVKSMPPWTSQDENNIFRVKRKMEILGKGLINSLGFKAKLRPHKYKKARYAIRIFSKKDLSKIIREFEKLPYASYEKKRPKYEPTDS